MKEIQLVNQINDSSCVHACLSMVTGVPIEELWEKHPEALDELTSTRILVENGVLPVAVSTIVHTIPFQGVYSVTVPSLNQTAKNHAVILQAFGDRFVLLDPQNGREGEKFWDRDCFNPDAKNPCDAYHINYYMDFEILAPLKKRIDAYKAKGIWND